MKTNIDWNKFKLFYYVAKAGSFTATSESFSINGLRVTSTCPILKVLPDIKKPNLPLYYVYPKHLKKSQKIKIFGEYLKNKFDLQKNLPKDPCFAKYS